MNEMKHQIDTQTSTMWLIYDGECPLCKRYTQYLKIKEAVGTLHLINAREGGAIVDEVKRIPYDLNKGMVLKLDNRYYYGSEALQRLATLTERQGVASTLNQILFQSPTISRLSYPLLRLTRNIILRAKRIPPIKS